MKFQIVCKLHCKQFGFKKYRSSRLQMYFRKGVKNFAMFTGKNLCSLFDKYADLKACNFIKIRLQHRCFPVKFAKFLKTLFFTDNIGWLLLEISHELSLYCIWEQWMVSFRGMHWLSSACLILLRVFRFFLFFSFLLIFLRGSYYYSGKFVNT